MEPVKHGALNERMSYSSGLDMATARVVRKLALFRFADIVRSLETLHEGEAKDDGERLALGFAKDIVLMEYEMGVRDWKSPEEGAQELVKEYRERVRRNLYTI